jgi:hypothetical protein
MKFLKVAVMAAIAFAWSNALAFHSGGVAECEGCHTMHNSFLGSSNTVLGTPAGPYLLKGTDQSSTCLNCHASADVAPSSYHIATLGAGTIGTPVEMTPGGDFRWVTVDSTFTIRGTPHTVDGERRGHNVVATDFGYTADSVQLVAPGGTYPGGNLHCSSCHDPHGRYRRFADGTVGMTGLPIFNSGSYTNSKDPIANVSAVGVYRILGGAAYQPVSVTGSHAFTAAAPDAVAPSTYNRVESSTQTVVAYGRNMSEWCANCHTAMHSSAVYASGTPGLRHPAGNEDVLTAAIVGNYNAYVRSGIMTGTGGDAAYSTLAPFENASGDYAYLKAFAGTGASGALVVGGRDADTTKNVACVSCHRAHAGGFESLLRFFYLNEFMTVTVSTSDMTAAYDGTDGLNLTEGKIHQGFTMAQTASMYYNRPATQFGPYARSYCNKCHAKD